MLFGGGSKYPEPSESTTHGRLKWTPRRLFLGFQLIIVKLSNPGSGGRCLKHMVFCSWFGFVNREPGSWFGFVNREPGLVARFCPALRSGALRNPDSFFLVS